MINLITGTPGSGKTSYALQFMLSQLKGSQRKIYVHGIPDLKIPHEKLYCSSKNCDVCGEIDVELLDRSLLVEEWHNYVPDGSVLFLDEVQNIYRPRSSGSKVPESIAAFEVHRHRGLDFFLITQSPRLIDINIRALVSRHIHLKPTWAGRFQYEWPECKDAIQSTTDALKSKYKLDKKTFKLYQSASIHTKQERKIPTAFYILIAVLVLFTFLSFRVYSRVNSFTEPLDSVSNSSDTLTKEEPDSDSAQALALSGSSSFDTKKYFTQRQLINASYQASVLLENLNPDQCQPFLGDSFKCYVSKSTVGLYRNAYCKASICYAYIRIAQANETE